MRASKEKSQANHVSSTLCQNKAISTQKPKVWTFFEGRLKVKQFKSKVFLKKAPTNIVCTAQVTLTENQRIIVTYDWRTKTKCILGLVWKSGTPFHPLASHHFPYKRNHTLRGYPIFRHTLEQMLCAVNGSSNRQLFTIDLLHRARAWLTFSITRRKHVRLRCQQHPSSIDKHMNVYDTIQ